MIVYNLAKDGDEFERYYWNLFIKDRFPSYENFWLKYAVPLTNRPADIHFKNNSELVRIGKKESDICIAQLSYSILRHLMRYFEILRIIDSSSYINQFDLTLEGMTRLVGCYDINFELHERIKNPTDYMAFDIKDSKKAKLKRLENDDHFKLIREYRNNLIHGRLPPSITDESRLCLPAIGKESKYLDWRKTTDFNNPEREKYKKDFYHVSDILEGVWNDTIDYLENDWKNL